MAKIELVAEKPEIGRQRSEFGNVRSLPVGRYVIYFRVETETLNVVRVLSAYRNVTPDMLSD